jgi:hypothetical protein
LLPEEDSVWISEARQAHDNEVLRATIEAAELALATGAHGQAERWAGQALLRDQFSEPAWLVLLRSFELRGQHAEGLRAYETCRALFASELGCTPGPRVREVLPRLIGATEHGPDHGLDELIDAVFRLHLALTSDPAGDGVRSARPGGVLFSPDALARTFEDDSSRLRHLLDDVSRHRSPTTISA